MDDNFDSWLSERREESLAGDGEFLRGTMFGDYRVVALLGRGGFADVYKATDSRGGVVAIKVLHRLDDKSRARFVRESEILSQIRHDNIPRLLCFGCCGNRPYMVTELLVNHDLPTEDRKIAVFLKQIISAVEELHRHGFVHRDIKPANILAREDGTPVLIDFGLACPISAVEREKDGLSVEEGRNVAVGTVGYSAPEQFAGLGAGPEADVHALGALIGDCFGERMPKCWRRIYLNATASNPKSRYPSASALGRAIRSRHRARTFGFVFGVILAGVLAFLCVEGARNRWFGWGQQDEFEEMQHEFDIQGV